MRERFSVPADGREREFNGIKVSVEPDDSLINPDVIPSKTAEHETDHILADPDNVKMATIVPGTGYLGKTEMHSPSPISAVAAYANGRSGTGHDMLIAHLSGRNISSLISVAKEKTGDKKKHRAIAGFLEERRTASGGELRVVLAEVDEEERLGRKVRIKKTDRTGRTEERTERVKDNVITIEPIEAEEGEEYFPGKAGYRLEPGKAA